MQRTAIILACFFFCANCFAQKYPFVHYTPREGLINNKARTVFQDSKGRLYISTYGGLSIYDGTRFTNYNTTNGLAFDLVNGVIEMGDDSLWILLNDNRIQCLVNGKLKKFKSEDGFIPLVNKIIKCRDGNYYALADEGLFRLQGKKFIKINFSGFAGVDSAKSIIDGVEADNKLYLYSNPNYKLIGSNLVVYDLKKKKVLDFKPNFHGSSLFDVLPNHILIFNSKGMFVIDKFTPPGQPVILKPAPDSLHLPKDPYFIVMYRDRQENLWVSGIYGLYRVDKNGSSILFTTENGLTSNFQTSILQDHENNMWFTNEQTGLCKLSNSQLAYYPTFKGNNPNDIFIPKRSDSIWLHDVIQHRLMLIKPNGQTLQWKNDNEPLKNVGRITTGKKMWITSGHYVYECKRSPTGDQYSLKRIYADTVGPIGFNCCLTDHEGNLVTVSDQVVAIVDDQVLSQPIDYMADYFTMDEQDRIWIAPRNNVLYCFQITTSGKEKKLSLLRKFENVLPGNSPRSIVADRNNNIWIGTRDGGLFRIHFNDLAISSVKQIKTVDGLSENFISYLYCDKENNIWACSSSGLDKIKMVNDHFLVENITRSNNLYLPAFKIQQQANGIFWILTGVGVITYNPVRIKSDWKPSLSFSELVNEASKQVPMPPGKELSFKQNNLTFLLSAPSYIDEKQTRFSYLLEGSGNKNWSRSSTDAAINFVNLPPGEYTLRAKAIFLHGLYPDIESTYSFIILPPWWQTWWFKTIMGLFIIGIIFLGLRFYINRKLERQRVVLEKRRAIEQERTRIATDMHDDLGAGLSQIKFLSETIGLRRQKHLPIEEEIDNIRTFSHEMIDKMGEIVWALNEKNDTLSDLLSYTRSYAVEYLQQNGINCHVEEPEMIPQDYVSSEFRRNIYLTVKESLHNVVKHAQATEVWIDIAINHSLTISIRDNGRGIDKSSTRPFGNGLKNMNARIKELEGSFEIQNNNGTEVRLKIPLKT